MLTHRGTLLVCDEGTLHAASAISNPRIVMHRIPRIDVWLWVCIAAGILAMRLYPTFTPELNHDSFQYLSAADNVLAGKVGYTSLIHYDVERSFGVIPAPMLTFPVGYPLAIALVSLAGVSTKTAALILSVASTLACIALIAWMGVQLGLTRGLRNVVVACFVFNGIVSEFGSAALSEAPFMFLVLLGVAALVAARSRGDGNGVGLGYWLAAGLAFGTAYFVRYAGLFFIVGLVLLLGRHLMARQQVLLRGHATAFAVACLFVAVNVARNILLVGNWHGRDDMTVSNPLLPVLAQTGRAMNALFLGAGTGPTAPGGTFVPKAIFSALLVAGIASLAWSRWRHRPASGGQPQPVATAGGDLLLLSVSYAACMLYAGLTSEISYGTARNFVPLIPLILLLFGLALRILLANQELRTAGRRLSIAALALSLCLYVYLNLLVIRRPLVDQVTAVAARFDSQTGGTTSRAAILSSVGPHGVILANNGQAVGHVLGRPTISMVGPTFSRVVWDEQTVRATAQRFHVAAIVISVPTPEQADDEDDIPSSFVRRLAQGTAPAWLKLEHRSGSVLTYVPVSAKP